MLLILLLLAIFAGLRGWFLFSIPIFGLVYGFMISDYGVISHTTSLAEFGINTDVGDLVEYVAGGAFGFMIVFERS